jgi:Fe-S-cluster containining protein
MRDHGAANVPLDLEALCQSCGLCCDGSLFGRVTLQPEEVVVAKKSRLRVISTGKGFEQPCSALVRTTPGAGEHVACSIYDERPLACRRFVCRLHDRFRREGGPIEPRLAAVFRVRQLLAMLEASGLEPADFEAYGVDHQPGGESLQAAYVELMRRLEEDFARA